MPGRRDLAAPTLGLSMLVAALEHLAPAGATESTELGPFHAGGSPLRPKGSSTLERDESGTPALVSRTVGETDGLPAAGALLDVWQNAANQRYAVQDADQPPENPSLVVHFVPHGADEAGAPEG